MLFTNKIFAAIGADNTKDGHKLVGKYRKLSKTRKLFELENLKYKKLSKFQKLAKSKKK